MSGGPVLETLRIEAVADVADAVREYVLVRPDGAALPAFEPGAHVTVRVPDGTLRKYSLCGDPSERGRWRIAVKREDAGRGGSRSLHERARAGDAIEVSAPDNAFALVPASAYLFIAGGIGITPIMAMAEQLQQIGAPFELHYSTRTPSSGAYVDELKRKYGRKLHHYQTVSAQRIDLTNLLGQQPLGTHLYVCGPDAMIEDVLRLAKEAGWPSQHVHAEHFTAPRGGLPFDVELTKSGRTIRVKEDESILQALESAGLEPPYLCRGGACGQCETAVVSCDGSILHYDHYLTDEEKQAGNKIMICVSRLKGSRITLDL